MNVALFGGTGFVGKYILNALLNQQYNIYAFSRPQSTRKIAHIKNINIISGSIEDKKSIKQMLMDCTCVIYNIGIIRQFKSQGITYQKLHFDLLTTCLKLALWKIHNNCEIHLHTLKTFHLKLIF